MTDQHTIEETVTAVRARVINHGIVGALVGIDFPDGTAEQWYPLNGEDPDRDIADLILEEIAGTPCECDSEDDPLFAAILDGMDGMWTDMGSGEPWARRNLVTTDLTEMIRAGVRAGMEHSG